MRRDRSFKASKIMGWKEQTLILLNLNNPVTVIGQKGASPSRCHELGNLGQMDLSGHSAGEDGLVSPVINLKAALIFPSSIKLAKGPDQ